MICRAELDKIYYLRPFLHAVLVPYHIKTLGAKVGPPGFDPPGLLREVIFSYNKYVNFMTSSIKTSPKTIETGFGQCFVIIFMQKYAKIQN